MKSSPLLTVVIPTHNRQQYARYAIESVLSINSSKLQLVVHDTSNTDELQLLVANSINDERLKYIRHPGLLSMTENHNAAMSSAEGDYVCLIGDDDTIMPEALEAVEWAAENGFDALSPTVVANYAWPDFRSRFFGFGHAGRLYIQKRFNGVRIPVLKTALRKSMRNAAQGTEYLPKIYHGFVRRSLMETIREVSGAYFHGSSPDVSGAIGVALMRPAFAEIDFPLTLPGASGKSNTGRSAVNTHKGSLRSDPQTARFASHGWPREVPPFFSVETVWAHAAIETLRRIDPPALKNFDFMRLYATCWLRHGAYRHLTLKTFRAASWRSGADIPLATPSLMVKIGSVAAQNLLRLGRRAMAPTAAGGRDFIPDLSTVAEAQKALSNWLTLKGQSFNRFIDEHFQ